MILKNIRYIYLHRVRFHYLQTSAIFIRELDGLQLSFRHPCIYDYVKTTSHCFFIFWLTDEMGKKAERLAARKEAMNQRQTEKGNHLKTECQDIPRLRFDCQTTKAMIQTKQREFKTWVDQMVGSGEVRWQTTRFGNKSHFAGIDSTELNRQLSRKQEEIKSLQRKVEHLENLLEPGRRERLLAERAATERDLATKMLFWGTIVPDGRQMREKAKKIIEAQKKRPGVTTIERRCVGSLIQKDENGDPANIRCYHSQEGECISCDCIHEGNMFTLSTKSQTLLDQNRLVLNMSVVNKQRTALSDVNVGTSLPNVFLPNGPRAFDLVVWSRTLDGGPFPPA